MAQFGYKAVTQNGSIRSGIMSGPDEAAIRTRLVRMNLQVLTVDESEGRFRNGPGGRGNQSGVRVGLGRVWERSRNKAPDPGEVVLFTKHLATMNSGGIPLVDSLRILANEQSSPVFGRALHSIATGVENGLSLSKAMSAYPRIFDRLYLTMVQASEASGEMDKTLVSVAEHLEKYQAIKRRIASVFLLPMALSVALFMITFGLLLFYVPILASEYGGDWQELPYLTKSVFSLSAWVTRYWIPIACGIGLASIGIRSYIATETGRKVWDRFKLKMPVFGDLSLQVSIRSSSLSLHRLLTSGVALHDALQISGDASGNRFIHAELKRVRRAVELGGQLSSAFARRGSFPNLMVSMVAVGEMSGNLGRMFGNIGEIYDEEVAHSLRAIPSRIIGPLVALIGVIIFLIVGAVHLPWIERAIGFLP